jgi:hypothetical protein
MLLPRDSLLHLRVSLEPLQGVEHAADARFTLIRHAIQQ